MENGHHWMHPGEVFTVLTETVSGESPFNIVVHEQGITLLVDAEVIDQQVRLVPSGHQPLA